MHVVGVDIGGTFTDVAVITDAGEAHSFKVPSTPDDLIAGVFHGLDEAAAAFRMTLKEFLGCTRLFNHGTTIATNAFIERKGAKTGLITTRGFGDTLLIQRMLGMTAGLTENQLPDYTQRSYPEPIVPRHLIKEVSERVDRYGEVVLALNEEETRRALRELRAEGIEALAVCFLWSFQNPSHERIVKRLAAEEAPRLPCTISSDLIPVIREYERTATTVLNSYLQATVEAYAGRLEARLRELGMGAPFLIMNSLGGVFTAQEAPKQVVSLLLSGPTGGVIGSLGVGGLLGHRNIITADMGGTSFDASLIFNGQPRRATISEVGRYHILMPMIQIETIGAGGGSIAAVNEGRLTVGPESAGARPGPACYGRGGVLPTVTDADLVLNVIDPARFLGGKLRVRREPALAAIRTYVGEPLGIGVIEAAAGIRRVVDQRMADLLRQITVEKGHDPGEFVLYAYGGAGPVHCAAFGGQLRVGRIVVPAFSTVHSAYGSATADIHVSHAVTDLLRTPAFAQDAARHLDAGRIGDLFAGLEARCGEQLARNGVAGEMRSLQRFMEMRYRRQTHELSVPVRSGALDQGALAAALADFERLYEERYGPESGFREAGIEITRFRVDGVGRVTKPTQQPEPLQARERAAVQAGWREVYFPESAEPIKTAIYDGDALRPGDQLDGPAILEYMGTTIVVPAGQHASMDGYRNIHILLRK
ncbi:MAG: hydantoinase/oxoprolinase family protein [Candidatus Tectomicrobia bacterium]|nr:hydantoinase/oxoprolinase family protein [Candidatus Tectomicrobia bacterium]